MNSIHSKCCGDKIARMTFIIFSQSINFIYGHASTIKHYALVDINGKRMMNDLNDYKLTARSSSCSRF